MVGEQTPSGSSIVQVSLDLKRDEKQQLVQYQSTAIDCSRSCYFDIGAGVVGEHFGAQFASECTSCVDFLNLIVHVIVNLNFLS